MPRDKQQPYDLNDYKAMRVRKNPYDLSSPAVRKPRRCVCGGVETVVSSPIDTVETCKNCGLIKKDE